MKIVLFACVHNAGRSQMAAALFNQMVSKDKARAISAGTEPAKHVHPEAISVMKEVGIDISRIVPQKLTDELTQNVQILITMGCGESCPHIPGVQRKDWPLNDPKGQSIEKVRGIRDEIKGRIQELIIEQSF